MNKFMDIFLKIVKEFFFIEKGVAITNPDQKIKITEIENVSVFITRKSVKHFTESRKEHLQKFAPGEQIKIVLGIAGDILEALNMPDKIYKNPKRENSKIFIKKVKNKTPVSVVLEIKNTERTNFDFEIVSIHPTKDKKYKQILAN